MVSLDRRRRLATGRRVGLAATAALHLAVVAGLALTYGSSVRPTSPLPVELVPASVLSAPAHPTLLRRTPAIRPTASARTVAALPVGRDPTQAGAARAGPRSLAASRLPDRYRLLAAAFNACPQLLVGSRIYRQGAQDERCQDGDGHDPADRPPLPRRYALDEPAARIIFDDKDKPNIGAFKIVLEPKP